MTARRGVPPTGVVLDTDGVLIDSATLHAAAWKEAFDTCLPRWPCRDARSRPFDADADYRRFVDGKSRTDGAASFLAARGIRLPPGAPGDGPGCDTVQAVAARKEEAFTNALRTRPVHRFEDAVRALGALASLDVPCAAVSASRHARGLLHAAGLDRFLTTVVDGADADRLGLAGKPDPALFLRAADVMGVPVVNCAVVEDALAGVRAGRAGGFGLVVGLDRSADGHASADLLAEGADLVVPDLVQLSAAVWGVRP
ncbi:HAD family hydrolase [Streptomyces xanthii]|uniref:HAD-IA family hydrolase n=1 Tax=Streptomyces xanthii TaxID=2768069 RepID=A0A7H1B0Q6_9ACTN|nr:HAD-IA family hydrolase [Streptomyces xanthii]QNS02311.1 HAD-IA family hydrolase [Streptomyces xanthii]